MSKKQGVKRTKIGHQTYLEAKKAAEQREHEMWTMKVLAYTQQEMIDTFALVMHENYGFGSDRLYKLFQEHFEAKYQEIMRLRNEDSPDLEYSEAKIEQALKAAWGKRYEPRSVRYDMHLVTREGDIVKL